MGPRIFGIIALDAPVVAVVRRGPTDWMHVSRWDLETPASERERLGPSHGPGDVRRDPRAPRTPDGRALRAALRRRHAASRPRAVGGVGRSRSALGRDHDGRMQIRDGADGSVQWEADEGAFEPDPTPPPAEASTL